MKTGICLFSLVFLLSSYFYPNRQNAIENIHYDEFNCNDPHLLPPVGVHKANLSASGTNDGSIHFEFEPDDATDAIVKTIEFSIDGGATFPYNAPDDSGTYDISGLAAGSYHIKARWQGETCELELGTLILIPDPCSSYTIDQTAPNILFIVADDFGLEAAPSSVENLPTPSGTPMKANMPVLENLASQGLIFDNAWSTPFCAPTRAGIITGKHGFRTGVVNIPSHNSLRQEEITLQRHIDTQFPNKYEQAIIGKWHLNNEMDLSQDDAKRYPATLGIPYFDGLLRGSTGSYYNWTRQITIKDVSAPNDILTNTSEQYITTALTDASLQWIEDQGQNPWHLWLTHFAPHAPFHKPPNHLHTKDHLLSTGENSCDYYIAMLESLDKEVGRLLDNMCQNVKDNTIIIFISDNGTPNSVLQSPFPQGKGKGTLRQGGVRVPMIVTGAGVTRIGDRDSTLVNTTDLFATIAGIAGSTENQIHDSKNLVPLFSQAPIITSPSCTNPTYQYNYTNHIGGWAVSNEQYKLIHKFNGNDLLFDINSNCNSPSANNNDPYELQDLYNDPSLSAIRDELYNKGLEIRGELCLIDTSPNGSNFDINLSHETSQGANDGVIDISFTPDPNQTGIEFSLDGITYPYPTYDDYNYGYDYHTVGNYSITGLAAGTYPLFVRWQNDDCPTLLGNYTINASSVDCQSDYPNVSIVAVHDADAGASNGSIDLEFDNNPGWTDMKFSINGGVNYPYTASMNGQGTGTTNKSIYYRPFGSYDIWAKWAGGDCPIFVETVHLGEPCNPSSLPPVLPIVKIDKTDESAPSLNDGSIIFSILDVPERGQIEFSIDGGASFPLQVNDNIGSTTWGNLEPGNYHLWARWGAEDCPIFLGTVAINPACTYNLFPNTTISITDESIIGDGGSIQFSLPNNSLYFEISIDGGVTYPYQHIGPNLDLTTFNIDGLAPRDYNIWIRWMHNICPKPQHLGIVTVGSPHTCDLLFEEDFESNVNDGYGIWNNGGLNCRRHIDDALFATSGDYCVRLRSAGFYSKVTSNSLDLQNHGNVRLDFNFMTRSMEAGENFFLKMSLDGGSSFINVPIKDWAKGTDFENNIRYNESIEIAGPFTDQTVFRFRCDASGSQDWVYIDDIRIYGCPNPSPRIMSDLISQNAMTLHAYPNPTRDKFQVEINSPSDSKASFEIINIDGKSMYESRLNLKEGGNIQEIDMSNYPTGIYTFILRTKDSNETLKIVKL